MRPSHPGVEGISIPGLKFWNAVNQVGPDGSGSLTGQGRFCQDFTVVVTS